VLLISAGLFLQNLRTATTVEKGFVAEHLLVAELDPGLQGYDRARSSALYHTVLERIRATPGVTAVGLAEHVPLGLDGSDSGVDVPGYQPRPDENLSVHQSVVSPGYFAAMKTPLVAGRDFTEADDSAAAAVTIVNQRFVDKFWPGQSGVGKAFRVGGRVHTIIGVVPTGKYQRLGEAPLPFLFTALAQHWRDDMSIQIRTVGDPMAVAPALRAAVAGFDPDLPVSNIRTMESHLGIALLPARLAGAVLTVFGALGLLLASMGIYGVMARAVGQRRREIGIRIAIGAASHMVVGTFLREGLAMIGLGVGIGLAGAIAASRLIGAMLYGGNGLDLTTYLTVPAVLGGVALLAIWVPSRRASTVDPVVALKQE